MKHFLNTISLGFFLAIRQVTRGSKWATGLIVFIMMLTFLNLVATSGFLVGIVEGASRGFKEQWTGDLFISNRNENQYIEHTSDITSFLSSFPQVESYSGRIVAGAKVEANWWEKRTEDDAHRGQLRLVGGGESFQQLALVRRVLVEAVDIGAQQLVGGRNVLHLGIGDGIGGELAGVDGQGVDGQDRSSPRNDNVALVAIRDSCGR